MAICTNNKLRDCSIPFPLFQPNTLILSEQINDNNDELEYRLNLMSNAFNAHMQENVNLENHLEQHISVFNTFASDTTNNFLDVRQTAEMNRTNLDRAITENKKSADTAIKILQDGKADSMEISGSFIILKSGGAVVSRIDLTALSNDGHIPSLSDIIKGMVDDVNIATNRVYSNDFVNKKFNAVQTKLDTLILEAPRITYGKNNYATVEDALNGIIHDMNTANVALANALNESIDILVKGV